MDNLDTKLSNVKMILRCRDSFVLVNIHMNGAQLKKGKLLVWQAYIIYVWLFPYVLTYTVLYCN
jgi:hypothetical protein